MANGQARTDKPGISIVEPITPHTLNAADLLRDFPQQREWIIDKLLRRGEAMNVISGPKSNKSWLVLSLALRQVFGEEWLGFPTRPGRVLLLDYELAPGTLAKRLQAVASAMGVSASDIGDGLAIEPLRGKRLDIDGIGQYLEQVGPGQYNLIVIDPLYRVFPSDMDENSNAEIANLYAQLQTYAERADAGIAVVHHLSKGDQSGKNVSDLGAGGGAQSRACDAHLAIRPHTEENAAVVSVVLRSFPPVPDFAMRWNYPIWQLAPDLNPADLRRPPKRSDKSRNSPRRHRRSRLTMPIGLSAKF
jgi:RecA-family ATPase